VIALEEWREGEKAVEANKPAVDVGEAEEAGTTTTRERVNPSTCRKPPQSRMTSSIVGRLPQQRNSRNLTRRLLSTFAERVRKSLSSLPKLWRREWCLQYRCPRSPHIEDPANPGVMIDDMAEIFM
jgi:hypothetical protein